MNAQDALKLTEKSLLANIKSDIEKMAKGCLSHHSLKIERTMLSFVKKELEQEGYKVSSDMSSYEDCWVYISWDEDSINEMSKILHP